MPTCYFWRDIFFFPIFYHRDARGVQTKWGGIIIDGEDASHAAVFNALVDWE